jgi:hypothetical protein
MIALHAGRTVVYAEITDDGMVRHPSFKGLSEAS